MEQIVKIFVHQSYFIENDLVVDYNVEKGALANISHQDWIALIPKGWSGVDDQVAFKNIDVDCDVINLAIKSITLEKKCFQNIVECEKYYQLIYISQHLEILGRSEYFLFLHKSSICNCSVSSIKKVESKENSGKNKLSSTFSRKILRRQSPTPHEFYKHEPQSQNNVKSEKSKHLSVNKCIKCNAPTDFAVNESVHLAKIQDLTINNEKMEQYLTKLETDLTNTLEVLNKLFKLNKAISQQKDDIQKFIDDVVDGLLKDDKVTFWARDQEFSVIREFPNENQISLLPEDTSTILPINRSFNPLNEEHLKAIIGHQEQTIQNLVSKIKELLEVFVKVNTQSTEQHHSALSVSKSKINNIGYTDIKGTTYFSPVPHIADTFNDINLYLPNDLKKKNVTENIAMNNKICDGTNNNIYDIKYSDTWESKVLSKLNNGIEDKPLTLEQWKKHENEYTLENFHHRPLILEKSNELESNKSDKNYNLEKCDDS